MARTSRTVTLLLLVLTNLSVATSSTGQPSLRASANAPVTIPLEPYGSGRLKKVKVTVAGDTLDFLFDTGGGLTVISPAVASRLGCTPRGRVHGFRMTGQPLEAPVCTDVRLDLRGFRTTAEAAVMDLGALMGPGAPPVHGMISLHTFAGEALTLDLPRQQLTLETAGSLSRRIRGLTPLPTRLATGLAGAELVAYVGLRSGDETLWFQ